MQFCTSSGCITCLVPGTVHDSMICTSVVHHAVPPWGERETSLEPRAMHSGGGKEFVEKNKPSKKIEGPQIRYWKGKIAKLLENGCFFTWLMVLGVGKSQNLPNRFWQTLGDALR